MLSCVAPYGSSFRSYAECLLSSPFPSPSLSLPPFLFPSLPPFVISVSKVYVANTHVFKIRKWLCIPIYSYFLRFPFMYMLFREMKYVSFYNWCFTFLNFPPPVSFLHLDLCFSFLAFLFLPFLFFLLLLSQSSIFLLSSSFKLLLLLLLLFLFYILITFHPRSIYSCSFSHLTCCLQCCCFSMAPRLLMTSGVYRKSTLTDFYGYLKLLGFSINLASITWNHVKLFVFGPFFRNRASII